MEIQEKLQPRAIRLNSLHSNIVRLTNRTVEYLNMMEMYRLEYLLYAIKALTMFNQELDISRLLELISMQKLDFGRLQVEFDQKSNQLNVSVNAQTSQTWPSSSLTLTEAELKSEWNPRDDNSFPANELKKAVHFYANWLIVENDLQIYQGVILTPHERKSVFECLISFEFICSLFHARRSRFIFNGDHLLAFSAFAQKTVH